MDSIQFCCKELLEGFRYFELLQSSAGDGKFFANGTFMVEHCVGQRLDISTRLIRRLSIAQFSGKILLANYFIGMRGNAYHIF